MLPSFQYQKNESISEGVRGKMGGDTNDASGFGIMLNRYS